MKALGSLVRPGGSASQIGGRLILLAIVWIVFTILNSSFASEDILFSVLQATAFLGLVAIGEGVAMIAGEIDLSVASLAAVAGILAVELSGLGLIPAIILAALIAALFGLFQGACVAALKINSLVFTIGSLFALRGVAYLLTNSSAVQLPANQLDGAEELIQRFWIFSPYSLITIGVAIVVGLGLALSRWGREIYAIGGARAESVAAGVPQRRPIIIAFVLSGFTAGLAGALSSIVAGSGSAKAFPDLLLLSITAVLVGGVGLYGGRGTILNIIVGCLIIESLVAGLIHQGQTGEIQELATGALLILVIIVEFASGMGGGRREGETIPMPRWLRFSSGLSGLRGSPGDSSSGKDG
jgi:ribose transport system permease protein